MAYDRDKIFANIGKGIALFNVISPGWGDELDGILEEWAALLNDDAGERAMLTEVTDLCSSVIADRLSDSKSDTKAVLQSYMLAGVRDDLDVPRRSFPDVLDELQDQMVLAADTVKANVVWAAILEFNDNNNQLSNWSFTGINIGVNTDWAGILYIDLLAAGLGHQVDVYSDSTRATLVSRGSIAGDGTVTLVAQGGSGLNGTVELDWTGVDADIYLIVVPLPDIDNAGTGYCSSIDLTQYCHSLTDFEIECLTAESPGTETWIVRSNRKADHGNAVTGTLFEDTEFGIQFTITHRTVIQEINDNNNQLTNWVFTGEVKSTSEIAGNTDLYGRLYIDLAVGGAGHQVSVYSDAARTQLVAQGDIVGDGAVTLAEQNDSGLSGTVDLTWVGADADIWLQLPFDFAVGDKFYFSSDHDGGGVFQSFFVDEWDKALPSDATGAETVNEAFAIYP